MPKDIRVIENANESSEDDETGVDDGSSEEDESFPNKHHNGLSNALTINSHNNDDDDDDPCRPPDHVFHPTSGFKVEEIIGLAQLDGKLIHYCLLKDGRRALLPATITNRICPALVISYYQSRVVLVDNLTQEVRPVSMGEPSNSEKESGPAEVAPQINNNLQLNNLPPKEIVQTTEVIPNIFHNGGAQSLSDVADQRSNQPGQDLVKSKDALDSGDESSSSFFSSSSSSASYSSGHKSSSSSSSSVVKRKKKANVESAKQPNGNNVVSGRLRLSESSSEE